MKTFNVSITEKDIELFAENQALGLFLSDYPVNASYEDVIDLIHEESEDVTAWEPFEYNHCSSLVELIEEHKRNVVSSLINFLESVKEK